MKSLCVFNHKTKYTDWCPIPNDGGWGICLRMWKPVKEVALKILNNGCMHITRFVIHMLFSRGPRWPRFNGVAVYKQISEQEKITRRRHHELQKNKVNRQVSHKFFLRLWLRCHNQKYLLTIVTIYTVNKYIKITKRL